MFCLVHLGFNMAEKAVMYMTIRILDEHIDAETKLI